MPTERKIEAAAKALYDIRGYPQLWKCISLADKEPFLVESRAALEAAERIVVDAPPRD